MKTENSGLAILLVSSFEWWKTLILSKVKLSDLFKPSRGFFQDHSHHESTPRSLKHPSRAFFPNAKKTPPSDVDTLDANVRRFLRGFAWLLLAVFGGALSYGSRGALDGAPSAAARLRQWPGWGVVASFDRRRVERTSKTSKIIERPCSGDKTFWMIHISQDSTKNSSFFFFSVLWVLANLFLGQAVFGSGPVVGFLWLVSIFQL